MLVLRREGARAHVRDADDGCFLCDDLASLQLAIDTAWIICKVMGLELQVKDKKKTAWSGVYWEGAQEKDVTGYEVRLPCGMVVPAAAGRGSSRRRTRQASG